ncbi:MAG TPA: exonuclease SbcCD subunit D [Candidatus Nanoarchaeia archaeon]|nr:exonuclease SbcCD subunit D [Candidatus Nanoarchaeia archaeon]
MKFAHMADCHIGSWRDPKLKDTSTHAFIKSIDKCIKEKVDFIIIAGDLFNTSFPRLDNLKTVVSKFKLLKDLDIPVYIVPGSHDYSPSGKTILDVLEEAGMFINVFRGTVDGGKLKLNFTVDKKTGAKITGMLGKRGTLERLYYEKLILDNLENEEGYKIFIFHSGIDELKPKEMENIISQPLSLLPKGFDYYAGGHVHIVDDKQIEGYGLIAYPGPLFPNSFAELEKLERGGFYIVEDNKPRWEPIQIYNVYKIDKKCDHKTPEQIKNDLLDEIKTKEFNNTIVLIRLHGILESGKPSDIDFKEIFAKVYERSAYFVMKSSHAVVSKEFEEIKSDAKNVEDVESFLIKGHLGQIKLENLTAEKEEILIKSLMEALLKEKQEGETVPDFEKRMKEEVGRILEIEF